MLTAPAPKAHAVPCDRCFGTGKMASEWDLSNSAVVAVIQCASCLGRGQVWTTDERRTVERWR